MGHQPFQAGEAGAIRFKPILLTALAAMIGAAVILADPIFQGLAISPFASRWKVQRKLWTPEKTRGSPLQARRSEPSGSHLRLARRS